MMSGKYVLFITLITYVLSPTLLLAETLEDDYLKTRNNLVKQYSKFTDLVDDKASLDILEKKLIAIIGQVNVDGFLSNGKINLHSLQDLSGYQTGFGQIDGLSFAGKNETLFVTTDKLLSKYLDSRHDLPKDIADLSRSEGFYQRVFIEGAVIARVMEIPAKNTNSNSRAFALLAIVAQDTGPFTPDDIFVFVAKENRILSVYSHPTTKNIAIPQCADNYNDSSFYGYLRCYEKLAPSQNFYSSLKEQAQSIVNRLERAKITENK